MYYIKLELLHNTEGKMVRSCVAQGGFNFSKCTSTCIFTLHQQGSVIPSEQAI